MWTPESWYRDARAEAETSPTFVHDFAALILKTISDALPDVPRGEIAQRLIEFNRQRLDAVPDLARYPELRGMRDLIDAGTGGVGTCLAKARYAPIDDARIDLCHRIIVDAKSMLHVGAVVLDHDVGLFGQFEKDVAPFRRLQV